MSPGHDRLLHEDQVIALIRPHEVPRVSERDSRVEMRRNFCYEALRTRCHEGADRDDDRGEGQKDGDERRASEHTGSLWRHRHDSART